MEVLGQLAAILALVSAVSAQGSGPPQPEITKDLLREKIKEFKNNVDGYVGNLRDLADDMVEKDFDEISSEEYGHLVARVPEAFIDGSNLYSSTMEYAQNAIKKLWLEIMTHNQGVDDGFESDYLKCSQLISFAESYNWDDPSFVPTLAVDYPRAWVLMAEDWRCLAHEFEGVFETCDKLTRRHVEGGMTLEDAVEGLSKLILGLTRLEDAGSLFHHAVGMIFPHLVPDFGAPGTSAQSGDGGSQNSGGYASKRNMLVRALEHMLKLRNGGNPPPPGGNPPPPTGNPPTSGENPPPPPPPGNGGSRRSYLERALKHMLEMRNGGNPPPPGGNPPPPTGNPPTSGENPPPPPPPGNGGSRRSNLERALDQLLRLRNEGNPPPPPGGNPPTSGENPPPPPPPPPGNGGRSSGQTRSLAAILRKLNLHK